MRCVCGQPCSSNTGGPLPPATPLISAPEVAMRIGLKPGNHAMRQMLLRGQGVCRLDQLPQLAARRACIELFIALDQGGLSRQLLVLDAPAQPLRDLAVAQMEQP